MGGETGTRSDDDAKRVALALGGNALAARELVDALVVVVQARVARALMRSRGRSAGRDVHQDVADLTQQIFEVLFADGGRVLRSWDAARGLSLANFVGLVAEREVASILRSGRRSPWTDDPTLDDELTAVAGTTPSAEAEVSSQQELAELLDRLRERLSPLGLSLFRRLFVDEASVDEVCAETGMTSDAIYAWRSRLGRLARELLAEIMSNPASGPRIPRKKP